MGQGKQEDLSILVDIIIVNYFSTDFLLKCLESIYRHAEKKSVQIFVVDNGSKDGLDRVKERFPEVSLTARKQNTGFARAVNTGIIQGDAPFIMLLNPDTEMMAGSIDKMIDLMTSQPDIGVIGPRIFNHDMTVQGSARSFPTLITALFGRNSILTKFFPDNRITRKNILYTDITGTIPLKADWISGACMMVRRRAVIDVGLMDERFFMYWEDADWCRRMWQKGWKVIYYPDASIIHYVGASSEKNLIQSVIEFHKSVYYFYAKHYPSSLWPMHILILAGLSMRICFVLLLHAVRRWQKYMRKNLQHQR